MIGQVGERERRFEYEGSESTISSLLGRGAALMRLNPLWDNCQGMIQWHAGLLDEHLTQQLRQAYW